MFNKVLYGDVNDKAIVAQIKELLPNGKCQLASADPPYGKIVKKDWDQVDMTQHEFCNWMLDWTNKYSELMEDNSAFYIWGGIGVPGFRPFAEFMSRVESETDLSIANLITWKKKRGYGVQHNYLFVREELLYLTKGEIKEPRVFNIPLLDTKRPYAGFNPDYPAKSEFYRRTNVWDDITEIMRGKLHECHKAPKVVRIPIDVHTNVGENVLDLFSGSGECAVQAKEAKRNSISVEFDKVEYNKILKRLE